MKKRTIIFILIAIITGLYFLKDTEPISGFFSVFTYVTTNGGTSTITQHLQQLYTNASTFLKENSWAQTGLFGGTLSAIVGGIVRRLGKIKLRQTTETLTNELGTQYRQRIMGLENKMDTEVINLTERVGILEQQLTQKTQLLTDATHDWNLEKSGLAETVDSLKRQNNELHSIIRSIKKPEPPPKIN